MFGWIGRVLEKLIVNLLTIAAVAAVVYFFVFKMFF